jgi:hypothetical protein
MPEDHIVKKFEDFVRESEIASRRLMFWRGKVSYSVLASDLGLPGKSRLTFSPEVKPTKYQLDLREIRIEFNRLFRFYSFKVPLGFFVPKQHIEFFRKQVVVLDDMFSEFKKKTLENYKEIIKDVKGRYRELAFWVWANQYRNQGDPPESFVEEFCDAAIKKRYSEASMARKFKFTVMYVHPPTNPETVRPVAMSLYDKVLRVRRGFVYYALKKRRQFMETKSRGPRQRMAKFFKLYKNTVFYGDDRLIELIDELADRAIRYPKTTNEEFAEMLRVLIRHLMDSCDYPLGIRYDGGQQI